MIQSYDLYLPTHLIFGKGRVTELARLIKGYGSKVLLTYGGGSVKRIGLYDTVREILHQEGCTVFELSGIAPNPKIESVREGVRIVKENGIDFIVAIGGGSVLDCSKAIACGAGYDGDPWDLVIHRDRIGKKLPVFDVMTMAATGSEYDGAGVITNDETKEKLSVGGCFPVASILDPTYTMTVPAKQTAAGVSDIISHTFEQYFVAEGSMLSDGICESMLKTVMHFGPIALREPDNFEARGEIFAASAFGCCGLLARSPRGPAMGSSMSSPPGTTSPTVSVSQLSRRTGCAIALNTTTPQSLRSSRSTVSTFWVSTPRMAWT